MTKKEKAAESAQPKEASGDAAREAKSETNGVAVAPAPLPFQAAAHQQEGLIPFSKALNMAVEPTADSAKVKEKKAPAEEAELARTLESLILDYPEHKYDAIIRAAAWAKILRRREENRHMTPAELLERALKDVLSGATDWKKVAAEAAKPKPAWAVEKN